jgi:hypothetical protein
MRSFANFAALMDYSKRNDITKSIFCSVSVISLVVTISLHLFKNSRNKLSFTEELKNQKIVITLNIYFCFIITRASIFRELKVVKSVGKWELIKAKIGT